MMNFQSCRRNFLKIISINLSYIWFSCKAFAFPWDQDAFNATTISHALSAMGIKSVTGSENIDLKAPQIAENGTIVPIEVKSLIENTRAIYVLVDKNPSPLTAKFIFSKASQPSVSTRIKMRETSKLTIIVESDDGFFYETSKLVKVTIGGCGEES